MTRYDDSRRRFERLEISAEADCRTSWGTVERVSLSDISPEGCRISIETNNLMPGDRIIIRAASLLGASGTVRWLNDDGVGVQFDHPLHRSVMDCFERNFADGVTVIIPKVCKPDVVPA